MYIYLKLAWKIDTDRERTQLWMPTECICVITKRPTPHQKKRIPKRKSAPFSTSPINLSVCLLFFLSFHRPTSNRVINSFNIAQIGFGCYFDFELNVRAPIFRPFWLNGIWSKSKKTKIIVIQSKYFNKHSKAQTIGWFLKMKMFLRKCAFCCCLSFYLEAVQQIAIWYLFHFFSASSSFIKWFSFYRSISFVLFFWSWY